MNKTGTLERLVQRCPELLKASTLACLLILGTILAASCGDDEDELKTISKESLSSAAGESATTPDQQFFPCYTQLTPGDTVQPSVTPTPETIRIQMLERPYRIVPNDIVLIQNRPYQPNHPGWRGVAPVCHGSLEPRRIAATWWRSGDPCSTAATWHIPNP